MSRFTKDVDGKRFAWGFDRPMGEYFFGCYDLAIEDEECHENCIFNVASNSSLVPHPDKPNQESYSNSELVELIMKYPDIVPVDHIDAITLDLPF